MNLVKFSRIKKAGETMATWLAIIFIVAALILGLIGGFLLARKYMMDYLKKNPPINEEMLRMMMMQMGQKPSQKKINQMMTMMNKNMDQKYEECEKVNSQLIEAIFQIWKWPLFIIKLIKTNMFIKIKVNKMTNRLRNAIIHFV